MQRCVIITCISLLAACGGQDNVADCEKGNQQVPCSERSAEENARLALQDHDFDTAIELLATLVSDEPEEYQRYTLLSAAYAGRAGIAILDMAQAQFSSGGSIIDQISGFLPDPHDLGTEAYRVALKDVNQAVLTLRAIPSDKLAATSEETYAKSATFQLTLYQSAYSVMYLNQFTISATTGKLDPEQLKNMTEEDAIVIIQSLAAAGSLQQAGPEGEALQQKVNDALTQINNQDGTSNKAKLQEFIAKSQKPSQTGS